MAFPTAKQPQLSSKVIEATEAGEKFVQVFYDIVDKRRQVDRLNFPFGAHQEALFKKKNV